jgi:hypothetical protein
MVAPFYMIHMLIEFDLLHVYSEYILHLDIFHEVFYEWQQFNH